MGKKRKKQAKKQVIKINKLSEINDPLALIQHVLFCDLYRCFKEAVRYLEKRNIEITSENFSKYVSDWFTHDTAMLNVISYGLGEEFEDFNIKNLDSDTRCKLMLINSFDNNDYKESCKLISALGWGEKWFDGISSLLEQVQSLESEKYKDAEQTEMTNWWKNDILNGPKISSFLFLHEAVRSGLIENNLIKEDDFISIGDYRTKLVKLIMNDIDKKDADNNEFLMHVDELYTEIQNQNPDVKKHFSQEDIDFITMVYMQEKLKKKS